MSSETVDMSLAGITETSGLNEHSQDILKKFHWAVKRVTNENRTSEQETALSQEELIQLIKAWEPQRDIICLYVRWARQLRRNFNLDSIATLLCLSRQCNYTPVDFLRKVKTLSIHRNQKTAYGVTFHFDIPDRKDVNRERLNKEFLGLSVTLALLQEQVTESPSILGKTKMRQSTPRQVYPMNIPMEETHGKNIAILTHPTTEFHTQSSLLNRIWICINHRWLALHLTEHLFREADIPWSYHEALVYSFQMMAPCGPGRFEFLSPLAGYCLRFRTLEAINSNRTQLRQIWNDPSSFLSYGNTCLTQFNTEAKSRLIISCFQELRADIPSKFKQISYQRDCSWQRRWTILRAYLFHFWLDAASNSSIKATVTNSTSSTTGIKKRKSSTLKGSSDGTTTLISKKPNSAALKKIPPKPSANGFQSIISSRRSLNQSTTTSTCNDHAPAAVSVGSKLGTSTNNNMIPTINAEEAPDSITPFKGTNWTSLRLVTFEEMQRYVQSYLVVHRHDGIDLVAELSPLEVYSANLLHDLMHCRLSEKPPFFPTKKTGPAVLHIRSDAECFIDVAAKSFHVARQQSPYFLEHSHLLPTLNRIQVLCKAIVSHGNVDSKRAVGQFRVNLGNGGQNWVNGTPCRLHGMQFENDLKTDGTFDATEVLQSIGQIAEFTWQVMCSLQADAMDHPIAPDLNRRKLYAAHLNEYLSIDGDVGFEDLTLVVSSLHPAIHQVAEHKDTMNDTLAGYTRTAAFNMVMIDENEERPTIVHLQVICNFRKVIGNYTTPFNEYLKPVAKHARCYLAKWNHSIQSVYAGKAKEIPTAYNRSPFFLDDTLDYTFITISDPCKHKNSISAEYILTEVNVSRTLSLSMFIDPIVKLRGHLKFDQTIELAFACSFLSNPFWFDWSMSALLKRLDDPTDPFQFGLHPFYDWASNTFEIFGSWQGGPYNRWSPCGGSRETVLETFGAQPNATKEQRDQGEQKLEQVIAVLSEHVSWINSLTSCGINPVVDMPLGLMKAQCNRTVQGIAKIASCQFSHFRLGILTTILSGCGTLKEGRHLRNLMYPVKGSASFKHLGSPIADYMSPQRARALSENASNESISNDGQGSVHEDQHDLFMQYLSAELGFKVYFRDEIECILCESHPMRSLNCRDWFRKGMSIYDCNENGEFFRREYGRHTNWVKLVPPVQYEFAYLGKSSIKYISIDRELSCYASDFGAELRSTTGKKVRFKGRETRTSSNQRTFATSLNTIDTFPHPSLQMADFYVGSNVKRSRIQSMFVLGDGEHAVALSSCNDIERYPFGKHLYQYLQSLPILKNQLSSTIAAGCYHRDTELNCDEVTFFPGHLDKRFVHTVWFVPIGTASFFTVLSVPRNSNEVQDVESLRYFTEWKTRLSSKDSQRVDEFLREFDIQTQRYSRLDSHMRLIYLNRCGSILSFPANQCYHATIIPTKPVGFPRDLMVFHPLDGLSR